MISYCTPLTNSELNFCNLHQMDNKHVYYIQLDAHSISQTVIHLQLTDFHYLCSTSIFY